MFRAVIDSISSKGAEGNALEQATLGWLLARIVTAHKTGMTEMPLHELFGVPDDYLSLDGPIRVKIPRLAHHVYDARQLSTLDAISKDAARFARKFNAIELNCLQNAPPPKFRQDGGVHGCQHGRSVRRLYR